MPVYLLLSSTIALSDEVHIFYIDDANEVQILVIDAQSSDADNTLAATLILEGSNIKVFLDEKEDLPTIAENVSATAPDNSTATAVSNTILGVGATLGGRSIERTPKAPNRAIEEIDTPPVTPPLPTGSFGPGGSSSIPGGSSSISGVPSSTLPPPSFTVSPPPPNVSPN